MTELRQKLMIATCCLCGVLFSVTSVQAQEVVFENPRQSGRTKKQLRSFAEKVQVWGLVQRVVVAVRTQNETPVPEGEVSAVDSAWRAGEPPEDLVHNLATNECAEALQALLGSSSGYASAFVTDQGGTVVCMTADAGGYSMASKILFTGSYNGGQGVPFVTKPHRDAFLGLDVLEISVPVKDRDETVGVLTAVRILADDS